MRVKVIQHEINKDRLLDIPTKAIFNYGVYSLVKTLYPSDLVTKSYVDNALTTLTPVNDTVQDTELLDGKDSSYYTDIYARLGYRPQDSYAKGHPNGYVDLDTAGIIPPSRIPGDLVELKEYTSKSLFPTRGTVGIIYLDTSTNFIYRWSGSSYVPISGSSGSAESALRLTNPRKINNTEFDGTVDIVTSTWGNLKGLTIGNKTLYLNGTSNYSYSSYEIVRYNTINKNGDKMTGPLLINVPPTTGQSITNKGYIDNIVSQSVMFPTGGMIPYDYTANIPDGFLRCNGALVDKTTYSKLYSVIGDDYRLTNIIGGGRPWEMQYLIGYQTNNITNITPTFMPDIPNNAYNFDFNKSNIFYINTSNIVKQLTIKQDTTIDTNATSLVQFKGNGTLVCTDVAIYSLETFISHTDNGTTQTFTFGDYVAYYNPDGSISNFSLLSSYTRTYNSTVTDAYGTWTIVPFEHYPSVKIKTNNKLYLLSSYTISQVQYKEQQSSNPGSPVFGGGGSDHVNNTPDSFHSFSYSIDQYGNLSAKGSYFNLTYSIDNAGSCNNNNFAYLVGCYDSSASVCSVKVASISGGVLGNFSNTTPIPGITNTNYSFKGRCFLVGTTIYAVNSDNTMYYATIDSSGNIASWNTYKLPYQYSPPIPYAYNNKLYLIGDSVFTLDIDSNGMFTNLNSKPSTRNILTNVNASLIFSTKNSVYFYKNTGTMYKCQVDSNGNISGGLPLTNVTTLSTTSNMFSYVVVNNCLFVFGFIPDKILKIPINSDGSIGNFDTSLTIPGIQDMGSLYPDDCIFINGYIYLLGCSNKTLVNSGSGSYYNYVKNGTIWYFKPNSDNTVDGILRALDLPFLGMVIGVFYTTKKLYICMHDNNSASSTITLYSSTIKADGSLSPWSNSGIFPTLSNSITKLNFYVTTYNVYTVYKGNLYTANIRLDGSIGSWVSSPTSIPGSGKFVATSAGVYIFSDGVYLTDLQGTISDYSPYYDPDYYINNNTTQFRLPDSTSEINPNIGYIIKT